MRIESKQVFNEFLLNGKEAYTNDELNDFLGRYDQISIQAVVDQVGSAGGLLTVQIEHSADGRNFVNKGSAAIVGPGTGPGLGGLTAFVTNVLTGVDQGLLPSLGFVRLKIGSDVDAHVKVHVTMRDQSGGGGSSIMSPVGPGQKLNVG